MFGRSASSREPPAEAGAAPRGVASERFFAAGSLVGATALGAIAAGQLARLAAPPERPAAYALVFGIALGLGIAAGASARLSFSGEVDPDVDRPLERCSLRRTIALAVGLAATAVTWALQSRREPPPAIVATWTIALLAVPLAFPRLVSTGGKPARERLPGWIAAFLVLGLAVAAWARLARLDEMPPVFSGDEVNQVVDGASWLTRPGRTDPFGMGWMGTVRLGMIPAGAGALASRSLVAGPRIPYAVAGTLAVAAAAAAAAAVSGPSAAVACVAFLALAPHHLHFSRLASVQILDSLFAAVLIALFLAVWRTGSPRIAAYAGGSAGLSLYGYAGGRVLPVVFGLATLATVLARRWTVRRREWLGLALAAGFAVAAGPNLRFAARHFDQWNDRFHQVSVFQPGWIELEKGRLGSLPAVVASQVKAGTLGLLFALDTTPWFTGRPMIGPPLLVGGAVAGFGWLIGRRRRVEALLLALVAGGNLAGVMLTTSAPAPQRVSSLVPVLAILAGAAFAGLLSLVPARDSRGVPGRSALGALLAGTILATGIRGYPLDWGPYAGYGGKHAALARSAARLLGEARFRNRPVYLHGWQYVDSTFPCFPYFLARVRFIDDDPKMSGFTEASFPPGIHLFSVEWIPTAELWRGRLGLPHAIRLPHPAYPERDIGYAFVVPGEAATR